MTRKHFEALATQIKYDLEGLDLANSPAARLAAETVVHSVAAVCAAQNPRFDRDKFVKACGL